MIHRVHLPNIFEPQTREISDVPYVSGMTVREFAESLSEEERPSIVWHNGTLLDEGEDAALSDDDFIQTCDPPEGLWVFFAILALLAIAYIMSLDEPEVEESDPFYGFQNSYTPEGDAVPLVYGKIRTAPPCINESIQVWGSAQKSQTEWFGAQYLISGGPITGLGDAIGNVSDDASLFGVTGNNNVSDLIGLEINGIQGRSFGGTYKWRTGIPSQRAIRGTLGGYSYTDPATAYTHNFEFPDGESTSAKEPGVVAYAVRLQGDSTRYVRQFLHIRGDRCKVNFFFSGGMYTMDDDGDIQNRTTTWQAQYWATDASGTALPTSVRILPEWTTTAGTHSPFSIDFAFALAGAATITGGGGRKGYATLSVEASPNRLLMVGGATEGESLDLICPCAPSTIGTVSGAGTEYATEDNGLKFTFSSWVGVPDWGGVAPTGGYSQFDPLAKAQAWIAWQGHEGDVPGSGAARWPMGVPVEGRNPYQGQYFYQPSGVKDLAASFGWALALCVDTEGIYGSVGPNNNPNVYLKFYTWEGNCGSTSPGGIPGAGAPWNESGRISWWVSAQPMGTTADFVQIGDLDLKSVPKRHVGFTYDQTNWRKTPDAAGEQHESITDGWAELKCYSNGEEIEMVPGAHGSELGNGQLSGWGNPPDVGYLYGSRPTVGPFMGCRHVPMRFFVDGYSVLRVGGWDDDLQSSNVLGAANVSLSEYLLYGGSTGDADIKDQSWFQSQVHRADDFGHSPVASVSTAVNQFARLACPFDETEVVATNFYKNYVFPDATTQAGGCL